MPHGRLYLVPTWLSEASPPATVLPAPVIERIHALDAFVVENAKSARRFLAACGHPRPMREIAMSELDEHTPAGDVPAMLAPALAGRDMGLMSEAGAPAIADPGALLVEAAHGEGFRVVPLVGPSSITLALMASGLEGQRFAFCGYLPRDAGERAKRIRELEARSRKEAETEICIETPYRNDALFSALVETCSSSTRLCVAADLTLESESVTTRSIADWRRAPPAIGKRPAVFLLLAHHR